MRRAAAVLFGLLVLAAALVPSSRPAAATSLSGTVVADTTWGASGSPYLIVGDILVPTNVTVTIEPGVVIRFDTAPPAPYSIEVQGRLLSVGLPAARILFTSNAAIPDRNDWTSIVLNASVGSVVEYTDFSFGSIELDIRDCSPRISNDTFVESGQRAIQVSGPDAAPAIEGNYIATRLFNQPIGIVVQGSSPRIRDNVLQDNYYGIFVDGGSPSIEGNEIRDGWLGFVSISATPALLGNTIEGNGLAGIGGYGILLAFTTATLRDNVLRNNGVGIDLPYDSRQTLAGATGNVVNGIPLETLYRYRVRDDVLEGVSLDSGRSAGFTGNATEQGLLTFYDSTNLTVARAWLRGNHALVYAANSSLLVENSTLLDSEAALHLEDFSQVTSLNTTFPPASVDIVDERSTLILRNFVHARALSEGSRPLEGMRVRMTQAGLEVANRTTGGDGWARWLDGMYGVLTRPRGSPAPVMSPAVVRLEVTGPGRTFRDDPRTVNLSASHDEVFLETDRTPPRVVETFPPADSIAIAPDARVTIVFSEPMNRTATEAAIRVLGYTPTEFAWTDGGTAVSFAIRGADYGASIFVEVGTGARDLAGNTLLSPFAFTFDLERPPQGVDLAPVWAASLVILAAGVAFVLWRSRARSQALREEEGRRDEEPEP